MDSFKNKKVIGIIIFLFITVTVSLLTYGKNRNNVFKDKYMQNIFIDEESISVENSNYEYLNESEKENNKVFSEDSKENKYLQTSYNNTIVVEIKGEVMKPDVYTLSEGSIVKDLIEMAGGLTNEADISNINRAKEINNHDLIIIRNINDVNMETEIENNEVNEESDDGKISINNSDISKLKEIPGVGEVKANSIILYREKNNGFKSIEELKNVDGIGEKTFEKIKDSIKL